MLPSLFLLLLDLLSLPFELLLGSLHVAATLADNVASPLTRFVNLPDCFVFLLLQEANPVAEELEVLLSALPGHLGSDQLSVQGRIVILFVWRQVQFLLSRFLVRGRVLSAILCHFNC